MDQYDNIRFSVTREDLRDFQSYGARSIFILKITLNSK